MSADPNEIPARICFGGAWSATCCSCKHWNGTPRVRRCAAFPSGIPAEIWKAEAGHREPYPGDQGIQYEPTDNAPSLQALTADRYEIPEFLKRKD